MLDSMTNLDILEVAKTWSYWDRPVPDSVPRTVDFPGELTDSVCLVVQGVRRCGKSTLLLQMMDHYDLNPQHCVFVNFEDPRLVNDLTFKTLQRLVEAFEEEHPTKVRTFFLDEIQTVDGWEKWLRMQLDQRRGNLFVVTGSNASLLQGELSSVLTGRHLTLELYPFDLHEATSQTPDLRVARYLADGGFPEPLFSKSGDALRRQYFQDIVERDIRERLRARSALPIRQVIQMAFESAGAEMSLRRLAGATGLSVETVRSYLDGAQDAYLLFSVEYFRLFRAPSSVEEQEVLSRRHRSTTGGRDADGRGSRQSAGVCGAPRLAQTVRRSLLLARPGGSGLRRARWRPHSAVPGHLGWSRRSAPPRARRVLRVVSAGGRSHLRDRRDVRRHRPLSRGLCTNGAAPPRGPLALSCRHATTGFRHWGWGLRCPGVGAAGCGGQAALDRPPKKGKRASSCRRSTTRC